MLVGSIPLIGLSLALAQSPTAPPQPPPPCAQAMAEAVTDAAASETCAGDGAARVAGTAPKDSPARTRQLETAAAHYRRAAVVASNPKMKLLALMSSRVPTTRNISTTHERWRRYCERSSRSRPTI